MLKKLTWIYLAIYVVAIMIISVTAAMGVEEIGIVQALFGSLFFLVPALPVALENNDKKCPFFLTLLAFLIVTVMFLGTIKFNNFELRAVLQAALFAILLGLLGYFGINRLRKNKLNN